MWDILGDILPALVPDRDSPPWHQWGCLFTSVAGLILLAVWLAAS